MIRNRFLILILFSLAVLFIAISLFLVLKVHTLSSEVRENVETIGYLSQVEDGAYTQLSEFDFYAVSTTNAKALRLVEEKLSDSKRSQLSGITKKLQKLGRLAEVNISGQQQKAISQTLFDIEGECKKIIREKRSSNSRLSIVLSGFWNYTYYLIFAACLLAILLAYTGYKVFAAKEKIDRLSKLNTLFLNNSIDVVVTCDKQGRIREFNKSAEAVFGFSRDEILNKNVSILYANSEQASMVKEAINLYDEFKGEILNRKKNGEIFVSQISANRLLNDKGKSIGSMGVSRDITKQKELETSFESIVNNVGDIVYSCDVHGNFVFVNKAVSEILGYESEELVGRPFTDIIHTDFARNVADKYVQQFKDREPVTYSEFKVRKKNGEYIWVGQTVRFVLSQTHKEHIVGVHGIARNIEALKKIQEVQ